VAKLLLLADAFRAILRSKHPEREDLQQIDSYQWFYRRRRRIVGRNVIHDQADEPAYAAYDLLKAGIKGQKIRLHGCLNGALAADINPIDAREGELYVFADGGGWPTQKQVPRLEIYESKGSRHPSRTYTHVHCYTDDLQLPKGKGGKPPRLDRAAVSAEVGRLMDHHGEISPDDPDWNALVRLYDALRQKFGLELADSTLESYVKEPLAKWRELNKAPPKT
jgi:hypothetical protein